MCAPFNRRNTVSNWERGAKESDGIGPSSASALWRREQKKKYKRKKEKKIIATLDGDVEMEKGPPLVLGDIAGAGEPAFSRSSCESTRE